MKVVIVSDSHRRDGHVQAAIEREKPFDMFIHLGDAEGGHWLHRGWCLEQNKECILHFVRGNCDGFTKLPGELVAYIGPYKALMTHGHYYNVSINTLKLAETAKAYGCQIAMYGHTHRPLLETVEGVTIINPGSISFPRQEGRLFTYMVMNVSEDGKVEYKHRVIF